MVFIRLPLAGCVAVWQLPVVTWGDISSRCSTCSEHLRFTKPHLGLEASQSEAILLHVQGGTMVINGRRAEVFDASHITVGVTLGLMADAHGHFGEYRKQKEVSERALKIEEEAFGTKSPKLCPSLTTLAAAHRSLGNYHQQKEILERVLTIDQKALGAEHVDTAATMDTCLIKISRNQEIANVPCVG